jgi:hypothetical protein
MVKKIILSMLFVLLILISVTISISAKENPGLTPSMTPDDTPDPPASAPGDAAKPPATDLPSLDDNSPSTDNNPNSNAGTPTSNTPTTSNNPSVQKPDTKSPSLTTPTITAKNNLILNTVQVLSDLSILLQKINPSQIKIIAPAEIQLKDQTFVAQVVIDDIPYPEVTVTFNDQTFTTDSYGNVVIPLQNINTKQSTTFLISAQYNSLYAEQKISLIIYQGKTLSVPWPNPPEERPIGSSEYGNGMGLGVPGQMMGG